MNNTYATLCGAGAALFSGYYPFVRANVANNPARSMATLLNAAATYLVVSKVAGIALSALKPWAGNIFDNQVGQVVLFAATVGSLFVLPDVVEKARVLLGLPKLS